MTRPVIVDVQTGNEPGRAVQAGEAVRVVAGAVVPPDTDAVVAAERPVEQFRALVSNDLPATLENRRGMNRTRRGDSLFDGLFVLVDDADVPDCCVWVLAVAVFFGGFDHIPDDVESRRHTF